MSWGVATQNGVSVSLASIVSLSAGVTDEFSPLSLFSGGVQGAWYDPSDLTTMFQDTPSVTPVTSVEQPVAVILDKSQGLLATAASIDGKIDTATWTKATGWTATGPRSLTFSSGVGADCSTSYTKPVSSIIKWTFSVDSISGTLLVYATSGAPVTITTTGTKVIYSDFASNNNIFRMSAGSCVISNISIEVIPGNPATQGTAASRPVLSARYNILTSTATLATQSVTTKAGSYTLSFSGAGTITLSGTGTGTFSAGTNTVTCTAGTLTVTVSGTVTNADLRLSIDATGKMPAYQAVVTSTNYTTTGFLPYLSFDGNDDSMAATAINFSATNKMSVFAGISKLSDALAGTVLELTADATANNGGFALRAPDSATSNYGVITRGTVASNTRLATTYAAPVINVIAASLDNGGALAADQVAVRINTATPTLSAGTATTAGNFANAVMYIGRRGGTTVPYNGRVYSLIVAAKQASATEISNTEAWVNGKTGAY